jgi:hypothetical protein
MARGQLRFPEQDESAQAPADEIAEALAAVGLCLEDAADVMAEDEFYLWPENVAVFNFWMLVQTQWMSDSGVRTGLNHASVEADMRMAGVKKKHRAEYFRLVVAMECGALDEWSKQR